MNPNGSTKWPSSRPTLALLLAALGMLGPFSIDTYLPAFDGIAHALSASPLEMQQTLSAYLFAFAFMSLFHGSLSDSFGRRPVVLCGIAVFTLASIGCALSQTIAQLVTFRALQGLSAGAGIVVSRAVIRDLFAPAEAQRVMSVVTIWFGIAPAIAPVAGGWLFVSLGWASVFWFLAGFGVLLWIANVRLLPETLPPSQRQPLNAANLLRGYRALAFSARFLLLAIASGVPFNGMFVYVLAAPAFLGRHLRLEPTQFFWMFLLVIGGIMAGAWTSGRLAGRVAPAAQINTGFAVMASMSVLNLAANALWPPNVIWALVPIAIFAFGWALMVPVVTLLVLDLHLERRGMASSMQMFVGSLANGVVAGMVAPFAMGSTQGLALASAMLMGIGLIAWSTLRWRWPATGRSNDAHALQ